MKKSKTQTSKNKIIHTCIISFIIILICTIAAIVMFKYEVEGELNAPFEISKIIVVSTAEGVEKDNSEKKWDFNINQNNDIYITVEKNKKDKNNELIKNVKIENINIISKPLKGNLSIYRPSNEGLYDYDENYRIENELIYKGTKEGDINNLEVSNKGGTVLIRFCNENVSEYSSNDENEISHDGKLLAKTDVKTEELKCKVQIDIVIETVTETKYKSTIDLELPVGDILKEGTSTIEIKENIIQKRI